MVKGNRNGLTFTECSVKICRFLMLSPPYWKWSYHNATQSECSYHLLRGSFHAVKFPHSPIQYYAFTPWIEETMTKTKHCHLETDLFYNNMGPCGNFTLYARPQKLWQVVRVVLVKCVFLEALGLGRYRLGQKRCQTMLLYSFKLSKTRLTRENVFVASNASLL